MVERLSIKLIDIKLKTYLLLLVLLLSSVEAFSSYLGVLHISSESLPDDQPIGQHLMYLEDTKDFSVEDVYGFSDEMFVKSDKKAPRIGFTESAYWIKLVIENSSSDPVIVVLENRHSNIDYLDLYEKDAKGYWQKRINGDRVALKDKDSVYRYASFFVEVQPGTNTYLFRQQNSAMLFPYYINTTRSFNGRINTTYQVIGLCLGIIVSMALYNLYLAFSSRSLTYTFSALYLSTFSVVVFCIQSLAMDWFSGSAGEWLLNEGMLFWANLSVAFAVCFEIGFLRLRQHMPIFFKILCVIVVMHVGVSVCSFFVPYSSLSRIQNLMILATSVLILFTSYRSYFKGYTPAGYFSFGYSFLVIGTMAVSLKYQGILPTNIFTLWGQIVGAAIQAVLMSLGVINQMSAQRKKNRAQIQSLNQELKKNLQLVEEKVKERSQAISTILNNVQSGLFPIDRSLCVPAGFSNSCVEIFEGSMAAGRQVSQCLGISGRAEEHFNEALGQVFADLLPEEVTLSQLPSTIDFGKRVLGLGGEVVRDQNGQISSILITVTDQTELIRSKAEAAKNQMLLHLLEHRDAFKQFILLSRHSLQECRQYVADDRQDIILSVMHTIKGNCAVFGLSEIASYIHDTEDIGIIKGYQLGQIERKFQDFLTRYEKTLDIEWQQTDCLHYSISENAMRDLESLKGQDINLLNNGIEQWVRDATAKSVKELLGPIDEAMNVFASRLGKKIEFHMSGQNTLVSGNQARKALDQVIHLLKNAIVHGIEDDRISVGKNESGRIDLNIYNKDNHLIISVVDDGGGIDISSLEREALSKGVVNAEDLGKMLEREKLNYLIRQGLSTEKELTDIAGRGIGMNSVLTTIESLGGTTEVQSEEGEGCTFNIAIPA